MHYGLLQVARRLRGPWWPYLPAGWVIIAVIILRFNVNSVATIGILLGARVAARAGKPGLAELLYRVRGTDSVSAHRTR